MFKERRGKFIVIEGTDGSGKTEQFNRLILRLPEKMRVKSVDFPRYGNQSAYFVENYLRGRYGENPDPKLASLFFALDRFDASMSIKKWLGKGGLVISNRYTGSNMGYQGGKIRNEDERKKLFLWLYDMEYTLCAIPKPDLNIILYVPAKISYELIERKEKRGYLKGARRDIHEASIAHLKNAERAYLEIAALFPNDFTVVGCMDHGELLSIEKVHEKVWDIVKKLLKI